MLVKVNLVGASAAALFLTPFLDESIVARCEQGETRTRTIEASRVMNLVDMNITFNGEEISDEMLGDISGTSTDTFSLVLSDAIETAADGRATKVLRTYTKLAGSSAMEGGMEGMESMDTTLTSDLEGETVIFTFDGEAEEYTPAFPEGSTADTDLLEDLVYDIEFAGLLPTDSVAPEATWEVELEVFREIIEPGGEMHLRPTDMDEEGEDPLADSEVEPTLDGTFTGTFASLEETDGGRIATLTYEFDITSHLELTDGLDPMTNETPMGEMTITPLSIVVDRSAKGTAKLVWNLDRGCLVSFELEADATENNTSQVEIQFGDESMEQGQEVVQEGVIEISYTVE